MKKSRKFLFRKVVKTDFLISENPVKAALSEKTSGINYFYLKATICVNENFRQIYLNFTE